MSGKNSIKQKKRYAKRSIVVIMLLIFDSVSAGWFGSSIEGAFGLKFDKLYPKDVKVSQKNSNFEGYFITQGYDNKLIEIGAYSKICSSKKKDALVAQLYDRHGSFKESKVHRYDGGIPTKFYYWKDDEIEVTLTCGDDWGLWNDRGLELKYRDWDAYYRWSDERRRRGSNLEWSVPDSAINNK